MFLTLSYNLLKSVNNTCKKCTSRGDVTYTCKKVLEVFFTELYRARPDLGEDKDYHDGVMGDVVNVENMLLETEIQT